MVLRGSSIGGSSLPEFFQDPPRTRRKEGEWRVLKKRRWLRPAYTTVIIQASIRDIFNNNNNNIIIIT